MLKKSIIFLVCFTFFLCENAFASKDQVGVVNAQNPIFVDKADKTVTVLGRVNGKYFTQNTRHAVVFIKGSNGKKSVFYALANQNDFYKALISLGAKAGNNMDPKTAAKTYVEGDKIKVSVIWNGAKKAYDINDVINDSNGKLIDMRFGGNEQRAKKKKTGCIACLDSCPVGIISNHAYTNGAVEKRAEVVFHGNKDVLPADGTYVAISFKVIR